MKEAKDLIFDLPIDLEFPKAPNKEILNKHYKALFPEYKWNLHNDCLNLSKEFCWFYNDVITHKTKRWLTVLGQTGTGKTEWSKRTKNALKPLMRSQLFHWSNVCDKFLGKGDYNVIDYMANLPLLVIDEIGLKDWANANRHLSALLNRRLNKWTILTSNLTQGELADIDSRIASRVVRDNNRLVTMSSECPDYSQLLYKNSLKNENRPTI